MTLVGGMGGNLLQHRIISLCVSPLPGHWESLAELIHISEFTGLYPLSNGAHHAQAQ